MVESWFVASEGLLCLLRRSFLMAALLLLCSGVASADGEIIRSHGFSFYGDLAYPEGFEHFSYVNPNAPKGGEISIARLGTFDSMARYALKGRPEIYSNIMFESLFAEMPFSGGAVPADQYGEYYGLLAHRVEYDVGKNWAIFHMRPEAKFSDGSPVTAHDVVFSHYLFIEQGLPSYAQEVKKRFLSAEAIDDHTVKFTFAPDISRRSLIETAGGIPVFSKAWYESSGARLDEPRLDPGIGSGPYVFDEIDINRRAVYRRNPNYWGNDLPVNVGRHNFDTVRIEYFADETAAFEAFKAGEYTFRNESSSKTWATGYDFPNLNNGYVIRETVSDENPPRPTGLIFNLSKPIFQDKRVREAIALGYNFEWSNASLQYGLFQQRHSYSENTEVEAMGPPKGAELALLQSLGDLVPADMLVEPARRAHSSNPDRLTDRRNLRKAMKLLEDAGWRVGDDGKRRNADGGLLEITLPYSSSTSPTLEAIFEGIKTNLEVMGITLNLDRVDSAQFSVRRRERDYDMIYLFYGAFLGTGTGLKQYYGSETASFSIFNPAGFSSPLVDAIIDKSLYATSREEEVTALRALDRALRYEFIMIPTHYLGKSLMAYYDMYEHPEDLPKYALGVFDFWWINPEKEAALRAAGVLK